MGIYVFLGLVILVVHIFLCVQFGSMAEVKGHNSTTYTLLCLFFGVIGYCLVAALPDLEVRNSLSSIRYELQQIRTQPTQKPAEVTPATLNAEDGDIICPTCGQKQRSTRQVCWNCGQHFNKD